MTKTPATQLTLREMRKRGYEADVVERWDSFAKLRRDLWGVCDVLCLGDGEVVAVQTTSRSNMSSRMKKIAESPRVPAIRKAGVRLLIHGWDKGPNGRYRVKEVDVS